MMKIVDPKTGEERQITVSVDEGIRPNTSMANLAKLKPVFKKDGSTTAGIYHCVNCKKQRYSSSSLFDLSMYFVGNASQVSDGAGAVLLMRRNIAVQKGLPILGVFRLKIFPYLLSAAICDCHYLWYL